MAGSVEPAGSVGDNGSVEAVAAAGVPPVSPASPGGAAFALAALQAEMGAWESKNFGPEAMRSKLGSGGDLIAMAARLGEVAHSYLKREQSIRGSDDFLRAAGLKAFPGLRDAMSDYLRHDRPLLVERPYSVRGRHQLFGVIEEVGELAAAHADEEVARDMGRDPGDAEARARDAWGDIFVYMMNYANRRGWDAEGIVREVWGGVVRKRDWVADPAGGTGAGAG